MKFKEIAKWVTKAIIACMIAFAIVSGGCFLYYNVPVHYSNETGATDYKWEKSKFYSRGTEGFALGRTDSDGFNNIKSPDGRRIDILFMGSSHGEAYNVSQKNSCVSVMNELYGGKYYTYNIAVSGHTLAQLCSNLKAALEQYRPSKYVVLECPSVSLKYKSFEGAVNSTLAELESESGGLIGVLQKVPYLRLMYRQLSNLSEDGEQDENTAVKEEKSDADYEKIINQFIAKIKSECDGYGVEPIIVYHPHLQLNSDGTASVTHGEKNISRFDRLCRENGVTFVDMSDTFLEVYEKEHKLPYGFSNTAAGTGHLNSFGHRLLAEKIVSTTEDMEAEK